MKTADSWSDEVFGEPKLELAKEALRRCAPGHQKLVNEALAELDKP